jgi:hypothetical protein
MFGRIAAIAAARSGRFKKLNDERTILLKQLRN